MTTNKGEMAIVRKYWEQPPIDLDAAFDELGVAFERRPLASNRSGWIERTAEGYLVVVNSNEVPQRQRFTAAHELAHYLLHRDLLGDGEHADRLFDGASNNPKAPLRRRHEIQANQFAADLLMPRSLIKSDYSPVDDNVLELAKKYQVSPAAMKIRLKALGLRG